MVLNNISTIITPSQYMANIFSFYKTTKNISIIPNFVIQNNCSSEIDDSNFFLFVGLLEPLKGAFDLVKTYCKNISKNIKKFNFNRRR
jgi:glycosyltransferase involved in cell wall biosynthesis